MKVKLLLTCLFLVSAVAMSGCTGLDSGTVDNQTAVDNLTATDNETVTVEPITPTAPAPTPGTPETPEVKLVLPKVDYTGLTQEEWEQAIQIALALPELSEWLEKGLPYRTEPRWFFKRPESTQLFTSKTYLPPDTPNVTDITPGVRVSVGSPEQALFDIAIDLTSGKTITFVRFLDRLLPASQYNLRYLTEEEFAEVLRIASEAAGAAIDPGRAKLVWVGILNGWRTTLDYDAVEKGIPDLVGTRGATFYPALSFFTGAGGWVVVVDLQMGKALEVSGPVPRRTGPIPNPSQ